MKKYLNKVKEKMQQSPQKKKLSNNFSLIDLI